MRTQHPITAFALFAIALLLAGCAPTDAPGGEAVLFDADDTAQVQRAEQPTIVTRAHPAAAVDPADAVQQRIALEQLLGHHATLAVRLMRGRLDQSEEFTRVAVDAVVRNTEQLSDAVASVYGTEGGAAFEELWSDHVTSLLEYAAAAADGDTTALEEARQDLSTYIRDFAAFVESATEGAATSATVEAGLQEHIDLLLQQLDAYDAGDFETAFERQRQAYSHMFPTGQLLAEASAPQHPGELPVALDEASTDLRSALGRLLGEHVELAIDAMRAGVTGAPHFDAAAAALNSNTTDLTEAIAALFGPEEAERFSVLWADHIDAFVRYTAAVAENDEGEKTAAVEALHAFHEALGQQLSDMTGGSLPVAAAAEALQVHDSQLIDQIEAYAERDYSAAYAVSFDAYQHIFDTAGALAAAIEAHVGPELPVGGARTGGGGTAAARAEPVVGSR